VKLEFSFRNSQLTDSEKNGIQEKIGKLEKVFDRITSVHVIVDQENNVTSKVELVVGVGGSTMVAEDSQPEVLTAVDSAVSKMQRQLRKHKEKLRDRHRQGSG